MICIKVKDMLMMRADESKGETEESKRRERGGKEERRRREGGEKEGRMRPMK